MLLAAVERAQDATVTANRMLQVVAEAHSIAQHELHVTTSIGVSVYPDDGLDAETLIKNADTAMYQAKENGRQRYQFFMPAMNVRAVERRSIEEGLRRALERHEFELRYQPKVNLKNGLVPGALPQSPSTRSIRVLINDGTGHFPLALEQPMPERPNPLSGFGAYSLEHADLNGDGYLDSSEFDSRTKSKK